MSGESEPYPEMARFLNRYLLSLLDGLPLDSMEREMASNFRWTSICVNQSLCCNRHRDTSSEGMSAIIALGPFTGVGHLRYWEQDVGRGSDKALDPELAKELRIYRKLQIFDGARARETTPFQGKRIKVTWFTASESWQLPAGSEVRRAAEGLGFMPPGQRNRSNVYCAPMGYPSQLSRVQQQAMQGEEVKNDDLADAIQNATQEFLAPAVGEETSSSPVMTEPLAVAALQEATPSPTSRPSASRNWPRGKRGFGFRGRGVESSPRIHVSECRRLGRGCSDCPRR